MIILDLDNVACDDSHRSHILDELVGTISADERSEIWDRYHSMCFQDNPANTHIWRGRSDIVILTGRPQRWGYMTWAWCQQHGLHAVRTFMRGDNDYRSAVDLKRKWLLFLLDEGYHIDIAYDDREDILAAYRAEGIKTHKLTAREERAIKP
jgi:hypothetical protein